jgi:hypothetical protein
MDQPNSLPEIVRESARRNDRLAESLSDHVQVCTLADLELIVRETKNALERATRRIARLERRLGLEASNA